MCTDCGDLIDDELSRSWLTRLLNFCEIDERRSKSHSFPVAGSPRLACDASLLDVLMSWFAMDLVGEQSIYFSRIETSMA
jgi:hypothetical protein